jgi:xanthine dehydrogenase YagR molybdenum-binding subunit
MHAATLLKITYAPQPALLNFKGRLAEARPPKQQGREPAVNTRGDIAASLAKSIATVDVTYTTPIQNHNPMEPHATIAWWEGDKLSVYDSTQYITRPHLRHPRRQRSRAMPLRRWRLRQ